MSGGWGLTPPQLAEVRRLATANQKITAIKLHLVAANAKGKGQHVFAEGPGQIDLVDPNGRKADQADGSDPKKTHRYHVLFRKTMTGTKDREGEREFDLLTFDGNEHTQETIGGNDDARPTPPAKTK